MQKLILGVLCAAAFVSCKQGDRQVGKLVEKENGLKYEYQRLGEEEVSTDTTRWIVADIAVVTESDSLLFKSDPIMPAGFPANDPNMQGLLSEGIKLLGKGDSVCFYIPAENFFLQTNRMPVPFGIDAKQELKVSFGVRDITNEEGYKALRQEQIMAMQKKQLETQGEVLIKDKEAITQYLAENKLEAQATESGLHYIITQQGAGEMPQAGDKMTVKYAGRLLDGTEFDAGQIDVAVGQGQVIRGWDEGLMLLPKGTTASFYIPSPLGYGVRGSGGVIPPNAVLVFDVEVIDINKAN